MLSSPFLIDQYTGPKKVYFMGSEMQSGVMRAQKREIQISRVKKITFSSFYMELEVFFTIVQQTYSKTCYKFYE
jgi:hypothetical protein